MSSMCFTLSSIITKPGTIEPVKSRIPRTHLYALQQSQFLLKRHAADYGLMASEMIGLTEIASCFMVNKILHMNQGD
ncbi:hypothetical protein TNCV_1117531 [Trichonephila clavipes]|nr:hypothetical protein TNCV_1117531 [Trichonephila clavipes]